MWLPDVITSTPESSSSSPISRVMPKPGGGVLGVGDDEIDVVAARRAPASPVLTSSRPGPSDDVADEEDPHGGVMMAFRRLWLAALSAWANLMSVEDTSVVYEC